MKQLPRRSLLLGIGMLLAGFGLTACQMFERDRDASPTLTAGALLAGVYSNEHDQPATYTRSSKAGVTVHADFTTYHKAEQPYGNWVMNASWHSAPRQIVCPAGDLGVGETSATYQAKHCAWRTVRVTIDAATGQGTAYLPPEFLDTVFAAAHDRYETNGANAVWHHAPGLYVNFSPADPKTLTYYQFQK